MFPFDDAIMIWWHGIDLLCTEESVVHVGIVQYHATQIENTLGSMSIRCWFETDLQIDQYYHIMFNGTQAYKK